MKTIEQLKDIEMLLSDRVTDTHRTAKLHDEGDHWQEGNGFLPFAYMEAVDKSRLKDKVKKTFSSEDVISKVVTNEQNGVLGRNPDWQAIPDVPEGEELSDAAQQAADDLERELDAALTTDWDKQDALAQMKEVVRLTATHGKATARAYIPSGLRDANGNLPAITDLAEAMGLLKIEILTADRAGVFYDAETMQPFGLFVSETAEGLKKYELTFVDNDGRTRIRILTKSQYDQLAEATLPSLREYLPNDQPTTVDDSFEPVDLGGELFYFELDRVPLITEAVISCQRSVNLGHSMQDRNNWQHGSRAVVATNAQPPTKETGLTGADGKPERVAVPINLDGSAVNFLNGVPIYDDSDPLKRKIIGFATPNFDVIEPSDPEVFIKTIDSKTAAIYRMTHQEHLEGLRAVISGKSKEESRVAFEKSEKELAKKLDAFGRWRMKVKTLFAAFVTGREFDFLSFRFDFSCIVDAGTPSAEIRTQAANDVKDGRLSLETYLSTYCSIEDAEGERERLEASEMHQLALAKSRLETAKLARDLGLPPDEVVGYLNIEDEKRKNELVAALQEKQKEQQEQKKAAMNGNGVPLAQ